MNLFEPPPPTKWNVLSLGAGVQSSCLALMAAKGEITPMPDFAVFADTQAEPQSVYDWLDWLETKLPFPIYRVTKGNLTADQLAIRTSQGKGKKALGDTYIRRIIPLFGIDSCGKKTAAIGRACTADYKIQPIFSKLRELCEIKRGQKKVTVTQWIGISYDELQRMKFPKVAWAQNRWPLIERRMTRQACLDWMKKNNYPTPPRSACFYCPFHSNDEWRRLRDNEPEYWEKAIQFDREIRQRFKKNDKYTRMEVFLHPSCRPLEEAEIDEKQTSQMVWDFQAECEGMCGV